MKHNHLLSTLEPADAALLAPHLEPIDMPFRFQLEMPHKPINYVYFPLDGIVSVVATGPREHSIEVGIIGRDGVSGHAVLMGTDRSANTTFVQLAGMGFASVPISCARQCARAIRCGIHC